MPLTPQERNLLSSGKISAIDLLSTKNNSPLDDRLELILLDLRENYSKHKRKVEDYLSVVPELATNQDLLIRIIVEEFTVRVHAGDSPKQHEYIERFPQFESILEKFLVDEKLRATTSLPTQAADPQVILASRYKLVGEPVGAGAFGSVYLGLDLKLNRPVAVKLPKIGSADSKTSNYQDEARMLAKFQHPNIVSIYDVGSTDEGQIYIVSQFVRGGTLKSELDQYRGDYKRIADTLASVSEALQFAHDRKIIHRDIKPANVLIDKSTKEPLLADFGLAITEEDLSFTSGAAGTPAYMSPEQIRGEGHRLDGRTDIFSLGVVLYELLTGELPFQGSQSEMLKKILQDDPAPPSSLDPSVPLELERICLKALSKQPSDRYAKASTMAQELRSWDAVKSLATEEDANKKITPKGLRSFDEKDAGYFLSLLPGPRNREGLPESIAFWKEKIEQRDPDKTFTVGLIYGPSGCGKSSLVKAGLIPQLAQGIAVIYLEASSDDTEQRILKALQKRFVDLKHDGSLLDAMKQLRLRQGTKTVLIIDQFEQWLSTHGGQVDPELCQSLRQCDGRNLQAILMIRDDFGMAAVRLMESLDTPIVQGENFAAVDLFPESHARSVFVRFGQAFGTLPEKASDLSNSQDAFVRSVVGGLAQEGKVISVRLALFADMVKAKTWVPETLEAIGGTQGVGFSFLKETFGAQAANPKYRMHKEAAMEVLRALMPSVGSDIKGHRRSYEDLLHGSSYAKKMASFDDLLRILDSELRLITPSEKLDTQGEDNASSQQESNLQIEGHGSRPGGERFYQLTHDYLVPSLRDWLVHEQGGTPKGRAELKLAERADAWSSVPEAKQLPTLIEWLRIRRHTESRRWTAKEQRMMQTANRYHMSRALLTCIGVLGACLLGGGIWNQIDTQRNEDAASGTAKTMLVTDIGQLKGVVDTAKKQKAWIRDDFEKTLVDPQTSLQDKMRSVLGLWSCGGSVNPGQWIEVAQGMLQQSPEEFLTLIGLFQGASESLRGPFLSILEDTTQSDADRMLASGAISHFDSKSSIWSDEKQLKFVAKGMATANPIYQVAWQELFRPVSSQLVKPLKESIESKDGNEIEKVLLANYLVQYGKDDSALLADAVANTGSLEAKILFPALGNLGNKGVEALEKILKTEPSVDWQDVPLDPSWKAVSEDVRKSIEQAHGMIAERFAMVQDMPLEQFLSVAEELRQSGYRPTRVRPWRGKEVLLASVFERDGRRWRIDANLTQSELPKTDQPAVKDDLVLDDLNGFPDATGGDLRYIALWIEPIRTGDERRVLWDLTEDELRTKDKELRVKYKCIRVSVNTTSSGERRYCGVYSSNGGEYQLYWRHEGGQLLHRPQLDVGLGAPRKRILSSKEFQRRQISEFSKLPQGEKDKVLGDPKQVSSIANAFYQIGDYEQALDISQGVLAGNPKSTSAMFTRTLSLARLHRNEEAKTSLEEYKKASLDSSMFEYLEIQVVLMAEGSDKAMELIQGCQDKYKTNITALYNIFCVSALGTGAVSTEIEKEKFKKIAVEILEDLYRAGYRNGNQLSTDIDLLDLYDHPRFLEIVDELSPPQPVAALYEVDSSVETKVVPSDLSYKSRGFVDVKELSMLVAEGWRPRSISVAALGNTSSDHSQPMSGVVLSRPLVPELIKESTAKRQARAAVALYQSGVNEPVWQLMKTQQSDARVRSYFQAYLNEYGSDPGTLVSEFLARQPTVKQEDANAMSALPALGPLAISLGDFAEAKMLSQEQTDLLVAHALKLFVEDLDSGVHGACEWLLRQLGAKDQLQETLNALVTGQIEGNRHWYQAKTSGQTYVVLGPDEYLMGSPISEAERYGGVTNTLEARHRRAIDYRYAIASKEVTVEEFRRYRPNHGFNSVYSREDDSPANSISWFDAVAYCNWLSKQEGLSEDQYCYVINPQNGQDVSVPADFLSRIGYRLPTEAEWEYACRSGSQTARPYGESKELLTRYAWYADNSGTERATSVGSMRPNDCGLFDLLGNIIEWNQNDYETYPYGSSMAKSSFGQVGKVDAKQQRLLRGGSFVYLALNVRSPSRYYYVPSIDYIFYGFRPSRTYR